MADGTTDASEHTQMVIVLWKREVSLNEILSILEEEDEGLYDIFIEHPEITDMTDDDSGKEDEANTIQYTHHLSGKKLRAPAELQSRSTKTIDNKVMQKESSAETGAASGAGKKRKKNVKLLEKRLTYK
ncbi:Hypothetical predicted protein [Octopus vulgaris]|uniref:Uncharacterized protein n=1 Tax=Octopus vulgaris TaxID=6645 RepID=A0AA36AUC8_OCTVU|nr:Hypothetical predicted protein [Octopus vulgaris]